MNKMYFNNADDAYPKADGVSDVLRRYADFIDANVETDENSTAMYDRRTSFTAIKQRISELFKCSADSHIYLSCGIASVVGALCMAVYKQGMNIVCAFDEDSTVIKALKSLSGIGITFTNVPYDADGMIDLNALENSINKNTSAVIVPFVSSGFGILQEVKNISGICKSHGVFFAVDVSLAAGQIPVEFDMTGADALIFSAEKTMLSVDGIGGIAVRGSLSDNLSTFEAALEADISSLSAYALKSSLEFISSTGIEEIYEKTEQLIVCFLYGIKHMKGIELAGTWSSSQRAGIIAVNFTDKDNVGCAERLYEEYGIAAYNDLKSGTVRFSVSYFNTFDEVNETLNAIQALAEEQ